MRRVRTRHDLWLYVGHELGVWLPCRAVTPGHSTPLDFVADAFFHPRRDLAVWANRSGLKTLSASIIAALVFRLSKAPLRARVLSGSEMQARNLYEYWSRWCSRFLRDRLIGSPGRLLTRLKGGDFEILAASQKRVRGAKVQLLFRDEVDEIDPDVFSASVGMLASRPGAPARTVNTSTWHRANGPMSRLVADAAERGIRLHKWNLWEALERCPPERHEYGRGCASCTLGRVCLEKARELHADTQRMVGVAAECCGLLAIDDAIKQLSQWSIEQWRAEAECKRPSLQGLVYPSFDGIVHVRAGLGFSPDLPTWRAIDWGWGNFVCLWIQVDKAGCVKVVDEYCTQNATTADNAREVRDRSEGRRIEATFCDPAGRNHNDQTGYSDIQVFESSGIPCTYSLSPWAREVRNGVSLVRSFLAPAAGGPQMFVSGRCKQLIKAFESYRNRMVNGEYVDEPIKPQACDHPMDALRYYFVNYWAPVRAEMRRMSYA
ncbi:MAG: hypothetical protein WBF17_03540 [Phycisphaerae bacterium]